MILGRTTDGRVLAVIIGQVPDEPDAVFSSLRLVRRIAFSVLLLSEEEAAWWDTLSITDYLDELEPVQV